MAFVQLTLGSLDEIDDRKVGIAFLKEVERVTKDCMDRPADGKARKVTVELSFVPSMDLETRDCEKVMSDVQIKSSVPNRVTKVYEFTPNKNGQLKYSEHSPDSVDQATFEDVDPATGKINRGKR